MEASIGERFARGIASKDTPALLDLLDPDVDVRAMTPNRFWEVGSAKELVEGIILGRWFDETDHIDALEDVHVGSVGGRGKVSYLLRVRNLTGVFLVEQQAYFDVENDRISWLRIMCSGYRVIDEEEPTTP